MLDVLVRGGLVVDGTGGPAFRADVGVQGGRIVQVGRLEGAEASQVIAAEGLAVAPGFIDLHSHSDLALMTDPYAEPKLRQGVTAELVGQCGLGAAPASAERAGVWSNYLSGVLGEMGSTWGWQTFGEYLGRLGAARPALNVGALLTHGAVRYEVMGLEDRPATRAELDRMKGLVDDALSAGAFGMSIGLVYVPCVFAERSELVDLCRVVARRGRFLAIHLRSQGNRLLEAAQEALAIAGEAEVALHVSHLCALGRPNWPKVARLLALIDEARARGRDVTFDQHPYTAGSTFLTQILPSWAVEGGAEALVARLKERSVRQRIAREMAEGPRDPASGWENFIPMVGWEGVLITSVRSKANGDAVGKTIAQLAAARGRDPMDVACDLLVEESGAVTMVLLGLYDEEGIAAIMRHPAHTVGSDALLLSGQPHPRLYGTFPRILGRYVRERGVVSLERAVKDMTAASAARLGLSDRGTVQEGKWADLVIFDPARVVDTATFEQPRQFPRGIHHVLVNGRIAVLDGQVATERSGTVLRG